jgi:hypothetical protein
VLYFSQLKNWRFGEERDSSPFEKKRKISNLWKLNILFTPPRPFIATIISFLMSFIRPRVPDHFVV